MEVNIIAVVVAAISSMVVGAIWYGPIFGKKWLEIIGATKLDKKARQKMQKESGPLYLIQFVLVLFQVLVLAGFIMVVPQGYGVSLAVWIWAAFVIPTIAGSAMWNNDKKKVKLARFLIQGGYQLVLFLIFGAILTYWR